MIRVSLGASNQERTTGPVVRVADADDHLGILDVERAAFGGEVEADLVQRLVADSRAFVPELSLVAEDEGVIVGHVLFTRATCGTGTGSSAVLLAPLAVRPEHQGAGVGTRLVREGLARAAESGIGLALVLGDPAYYSRFGFEPALPHGILSPYPVEPAEAWMALELIPGTLAESVGAARFAQAFQDPDLWRE